MMGRARGEGLGFVVDVAAMNGEAGPLRKAGDGAGDIGMKLVDVVVEEDMVVESIGEEVVFVGRGAGDGRAGGVDESAEYAGEGGFACCDGAGEGEHGIGSGGTERGEEPDESSGKSGAGDAEDFVKLVDEGHGSGDGVRDRDGVVAGEEVKRLESGVRRRGSARSRRCCGSRR